MAFTMTQCFIPLPGDVKNLFSESYTHAYLSRNGETTLVNSANESEKLELGKYGKDAKGVLTPITDENTKFLHKIALNSLVSTLTKKLKTASMVGYFDAEILSASANLDDVRAETLELLAKSAKNPLVKASLAMEAAPIELDSEQQQSLLNRAKEVDEEASKNVSTLEDVQYERIMSLASVTKQSLKDACTNGNNLQQVSEWFGFEATRWDTLVSQIKHYREEHSTETTASTEVEQLVSAQ